MTVTFRPAELRALDALADALKLSREEIVRILIMRESTRRGPR